jgi:hypothetical protein
MQGYVISNSDEISLQMWPRTELESMGSRVIYHELELKGC